MPDASATTRPYRLFFSHGGEDTYIVKGFFKPKVESTGAQVFLDAGGIQYGDDFRTQILNELKECDELLVLFTPSSLKRPWIFAEVGAALIRAHRIVAVIYGTTETELQSLGILSLLGPISLLKPDDFDGYLEQLQERVKAHNNV